MRSDLVVISWWSNALGLACLHALARHTRRPLYVVQAGKPEAQKERFRALMPPQAVELPYPAGRGAEDWRVREAVARELLAGREGLWFVDHDLLLREDAEPWLDAMDRRLETSGACLCYAVPRRGPGLTSPAFWLSPARFPGGMPGLAPLPARDNPIAGRPYEPVGGDAAELIRPEKDTLAAAMEFLAPLGLVAGYPLSEADRASGGPDPFPRCHHLGGLYTFALGPLPERFRDWLDRCVQQFAAFYDECRPEWVAVEDPVLLARLAAARERLSAGRV